MGDTLVDNSLKSRRLDTLGTALVYPYSRIPVAPEWYTSEFGHMAPWFDYVPHFDLLSYL